VAALPLAKRFNLCPLSIGQNKAIHKQRESQLPRPGESLKSQQTLEKRSKKLSLNWARAGFAATGPAAFFKKRPLS
ncbi:MAG TPA: hypothetical protein VL356_14895, partial [Acidocella sp.]|nr:hypothetical protein [Acidocella sp.]